ncbi:unnamed protein product [Protopolystoma xenopodis]|uniref:Uncharacterized protein n=1 Tax=Protopolystoma xenopodis TaxID=117903 RepID=A0A3S5AKV8_9PLAT|nr:unnamed protein product [Protopolystoma xenopodis]
MVRHLLLATGASFKLPKPSSRKFETASGRWQSQQIRCIGTSVSTCECMCRCVGEEGDGVLTRNYGMWCGDRPRLGQWSHNPLQQAQLTLKLA